MHLQKNVLDTIRKFNMFCRCERVVVGLSGGADSCVLLHVLHTLQNELDITLVAAHLNHGIRGAEAERDLAASKDFCAALGVEFVCKHEDVPCYAKTHKISEEMAGRELRYSFFEEVCRQHKCTKIAVAHNQNDSVETIILNLLRGSGANGFEGIKPTNGNIARPLINVTREEIEEYALCHNISYVTDSTNLSDQYARNIVRNDILPRMKSINSAAMGNLIKCSEIISAENDFFDTLIAEQTFYTITDSKAFISRKMLGDAHIALARRVVLSAIKELAGSSKNICSKQIDALIGNLGTGLVYSFGNGYSAVIDTESVIITNSLAYTAPYEYKFKPPCTIRVEETGFEYKFEFVEKIIKGPDTICISADSLGEDDELTIRTRIDGDHFVPFGMKGKKKLKSFYIEQKIPAYMRNHYPLLVNHNEICAVIPLRISENYRISKDTKKILMITKLGGTYDEK